MRWIAILFAACGGGGSSLEVPEEECVEGRLRYEHTLSLDGGVAEGSGDLTIDGTIFINKLGAEPGYLELRKSGTSGSSTVVRVEFDELVANGQTVEARGFVKLVDQEIDAGNCETGGTPGRFTDFGGGWKFTLEDLHASPYCSGATFSGAFAGCTRSGN